MDIYTSTAKRLEDILVHQGEGLCTTVSDQLRADLMAPELEELDLWLKPSAVFVESATICLPDLIFVCTIIAEVLCVATLRIVKQLVYFLDIVDGDGSADKPPLDVQRNQVFALASDRKLQAISIHKHIPNAFQLVHIDAEKLQEWLVELLRLYDRFAESGAGPLHAQAQLMQIAT